MYRMLAPADGDYRHTYVECGILDGVMDGHGGLMKMIADVLCVTCLNLPWLIPSRIYIRIVVVGWLPSYIYVPKAPPTHVFSCAFV